MPLHSIHRRYYAEDLVRRRRAAERRRQVASQRTGRIDPNPHQIDAVMFALRRIPQGGCILADEVGLGKTIEAGLVIAQLRSEGASRILILVPRPLLGQWQTELYDLFGIDAVDAATPDADLSEDGVFLAGREYAGGEGGSARFRAAPPFDLCVIDEAHEIFAGIYRRFDRHGVYDENSRAALTAHRVRGLIGAAPVLLLTATPIQNSLRELWGLVQYVDPSRTLLGDRPVFENVFCADDGRGVVPEQSAELRRRLDTVVKRTLRRQAQEFLDKPFVGRQARLFEYSMGPGERALYDDVTTYLMTPRLHAFDGRSRQLLLLGFHRRMASSTAALARCLENVAARLRAMLDGVAPGGADDFIDDLEETGDEWPLPEDPPADPGTVDREGVRAELALVEAFARRARDLPEDGKAASLVSAVRAALERPADRRKMVVFTEALTTQDYLRQLLLDRTALRNRDITLFRGTNDSPRAREALRAWREDPDAGDSRARHSASVAVRLALVHEFRTRSVVMICSEAGAKGLNLQFCDTVVNYDLPWNPQRIEQRIGRCHRYGQQRDVTVINFLAKDNEAQRLTHEILSTKLELFGEVLDMSDAVLQSPSSSAAGDLVSALGPEFENQVRRIWERARSIGEVEDELRRLRDDMEERRRALELVRKRTAGLIDTEFDDSVREVFRRIRSELPRVLADLDADLERVVAAYLDAVGAPWSTAERDGARLLHIGAAPGLPPGWDVGATVAVGPAGGQTDLQSLHPAHPLAEAAVAEARRAGSGPFRVRFELRPDAPSALVRRRGGRGRLAHRGFEGEDRLHATAVFERDGVLRPAEAALELLRQPCADAAPFDPPLSVDSGHLDEVVDEEVFLDGFAVSDADRAGFDAAMEQLEQHAEDRALVLRRTRDDLARRLAIARRDRESAVGADSRGRADARVRALEGEMEDADRGLRDLAARDDETYRRHRERARARRYAPPCAERLLTAEFEIG